MQVGEVDIELSEKFLYAVPLVQLQRVLRSLDRIQDIGSLVYNPLKNFDIHS